jgi:uncharacterized membrane protein YgdD (TMEM256/DUF423 family)
MRESSSIRAGALLAGLAVGLGAFAAHGMKAHFDADALQIFEKGVRYQMYHALAMMLCGALAGSGRRTGPASVAFLTGIALFSGSLYALVFFDAKWLGALTPFGGVAFLLGWLLLAWCAAPGSSRDATLEPPRQPS